LLHEAVFWLVAAILFLPNSLVHLFFRFQVHIR
jgi:hypothetical protein